MWGEDLEQQAPGFGGQPFTRAHPLPERDVLQSEVNTPAPSLVRQDRTDHRGRLMTAVLKGIQQRGRVSDGLPTHDPLIRTSAHPFVVWCCPLHISTASPVVSHEHTTSTSSHPVCVSAAPAGHPFSARLCRTAGEPGGWAGACGGAVKGSSTAKARAGAGLLTPPRVHFALRWCRDASCTRYSADRPSYM